MWSTTKSRFVQPCTDSSHVLHIVSNICGGELKVISVIMGCIIQGHELIEGAALPQLPL